jgi:hypothetical protein
MQKKVSKKKLRFLLLPDRFCNFHFFLTFFQKSTSIRPKKWRKKWKIRKSKYISLIFYKINIWIILSFLIKFWPYKFLFHPFFLVLNILFRYFMWVIIIYNKWKQNTINIDICLKNAKNVLNLFNIKTLIIIYKDFILKKLIMHAHCVRKIYLNLI